MHRMVFAAVPFLLASAAHGGDAPRTITDFAGDGAALSWVAVNDDVMGGRSQGSARVDGGTLVFSGVLNTNGGGFASVRWAPRAFDLGDARGILLRVRGDGRTYSMRLTQRGDEAERVSYRASFETSKDDAWRDVWLPFRSFVPMWRGRVLDRPPVDPGRVASLGFLLADGIDGPFRLEVDAIAAYPHFSMEPWRWSRRPLVVFAPREHDPRLAKQLAAVRDNEAGFRDRDMALLVVLEEGPSRAGERPLTAQEAADLRERFDVDPGAFAVLLVGKDGGVKRRDAEPVPMAEIHARIDGMPMRRAEIERRAR